MGHPPEVAVLEPVAVAFEGSTRRSMADEPGTRPFDLLELGADLEAALGCASTSQTLREGLRDEVLAEAVPL